MHETRRQADDAAFEEMIEEVETETRRLYEEAKAEHGVANKVTSHFRLVPLYMAVIKDVLRSAFDAGKEHGLEMRGCCEEGTDAV